MSAWYVLSSMGFYPVCPGSVYYELGSPLFPSCTIHLENGKSISLFTKNYSDKNEYVSNIQVNDKPFEGSCLNYAELANKTGMMDGIKLSFEMSTIPKGRTIDVLKKKTLYNSPHPIIIAPTINSTTLFFKNSLTIELNTNSENCKTYYTTDGTKPSIMPSSPPAVYCLL